MKNPKRQSVVLAAIFVLFLIACNPDPTVPYQPPPSLGEITITPNKDVTTGATYKTLIKGIYSVTVNKQGYIGKTSAVVIVTDPVLSSLDTVERVISQRFPGTARRLLLP